MSSLKLEIGALELATMTEGTSATMATSTNSSDRIRRRDKAPDRRRASRRCRAGACSRPVRQWRQDCTQLRHGPAASPLTSERHIMRELDVRRKVACPQDRGHAVNQKLSDAVDRRD